MAVFAYADNITSNFSKTVFNNYTWSILGDLLQEKGPSNFAFPTAFPGSQLSLTAF